MKKKEEEEEKKEKLNANCLLIRTELAGRTREGMVDSNGRTGTTWLGLGELRDLAKRRKKRILILQEFGRNGGKKGLAF